MNWTQADLERHMQSRGLIVQPEVKIVAPEGPMAGANKTELAYGQYLDLQKKVSDLEEWWFHSIKLSVGIPGARCWWTPDFFLLYKDGHREIHDTKGTKRVAGSEKPYFKQHSRVKACAVVREYGWSVYFVYRLRNGEWERRAM